MRPFAASAVRKVSAVAAAFGPVRPARGATTQLRSKGAVRGARIPSSRVEIGGMASGSEALGNGPLGQGALRQRTLRQGTLRDRHAGPALTRRFPPWLGGGLRLGDHLRC